MCKKKSPSFCVCNVGQAGPQTCGEGHLLSRPLGSLGSTSGVSEQGGSPLQCESEPWVLIKQVASRGPLLGQLTFIEHLLRARHIYSYPKFSEVPVLQMRKMKHSKVSRTWLPVNDRVNIQAQVGLSPRLELQTTVPYGLHCSS